MSMQSFYNQLSASTAGRGSYFQWLAGLTRASLSQVREVKTLLYWEMWG